MNLNYNLDWNDKEAFENAVAIFSRLKGERKIAYEYVTNQFSENDIQVKIDAKKGEDIFLFALLFSDLKNTKSTIPANTKSINNENIIINIRRRFYKLLTILLLFFTLLFTLVVAYSYFLPREMNNTTLFNNNQ